MMNEMLLALPMSGLFDVMGMMDETVLRKMVSDSRMVTPKQSDCSNSSVGGFMPWFLFLVVTITKSVNDDCWRDKKTVYYTQEEMG